MFSLFNGDIQGAGRGATNQVFQVSLPLAAGNPMFSLFNGDIRGAGPGATNQVFQVSLPLAAETPTLQLQQFQAEKGFN